MALASTAQAGPAYAETLVSPWGNLDVQALARLDNPWAVASLPDGRLLISEKPGRLRIYSGGALSEPVGGVPKVEHHEQGGLLGVTVDPLFSSNQRVYFAYSEAADMQPDVDEDPGDPRLGEFQEAKDTVLKGLAVARARLEGQHLRDVQVIWRQVPKTIGRGHFGGRLVFDPDGMLFITSGDRQRFDPAQDLSSNLGKIVRILPDGSTPNDNPFAGQPGARPDIWSLGHRNQLGAAFDLRNGALVVCEMGPKGGDEINIIDKGRNYGWPLVSEGKHYDDAAIPSHTGRPQFKAPAGSWVPSISPSGLAFYTGELFPEWKDKALMGALSGESLLVLTLGNGRVTAEERIAMKRRIRDVAVASDGAVLVLSDGDDGELLRLTPGQRPVPSD